MTRTSTRTVRGHLLLVQEQRFRLTTEDGQNYLLTLAHDANTDSESLRSLLERGAQVAVEYSGQPGFESGLAHAVRPLERTIGPVP